VTRADVLVGGGALVVLALLFLAEVRAPCAGVFARVASAWP